MEYILVLEYVLFLCLGKFRILGCFVSDYVVESIGYEFCFIFLEFIECDSILNNWDKILLLYVVR